MSQSEEIFSWETPPELWRGLKPTGSMWSGSVVSIFIAPGPSGSMVSLPEVCAFTDRGLEGDRFFRESWSALNRPDKAVSLIEDEVLQLAAKELGVASIADKTRRNIVTGGVPLVELLQREFVIGGVRMRGIRLFEPCGHLEKISKVPGIFKTLERRSGLKAAILSDGMIRVGDKITLQPAASMATA
jgi:MOSC domain-containing protein YiiM